MGISIKMPEEWIFKTFVSKLPLIFVRRATNFSQKHFVSSYGVVSYVEGWVGLNIVEKWVACPQNYRNPKHGLAKLNIKVHSFSAMG